MRLKITYVELKNVENTLSCSSNYKSFLNVMRNYIRLEKSIRNGAY